MSLVEELCHGQIEYVDGKSMSEDKIKKEHYESILIRKGFNRFFNMFCRSAVTKSKAFTHLISKVFFR